VIRKGVPCDSHSSLARHGLVRDLEPLPSLLGPSALLVSSFLDSVSPSLDVFQNAPLGAKASMAL
jgi:hypothetical protein